MPSKKQYAKQGDIGTDSLDPSVASASGDYDYDPSGEGALRGASHEPMSGIEGKTLSERRMENIMYRYKDV